MGAEDIRARAATALPRRSVACLTAAVAVCWMAGNERASAFPDTGYPYPGSSLVPVTTPGAPTDVQHHIAGGPAVEPPGPPEPGWTILPRIDVSEAFNDNIFLRHINRRSYFKTYIPPGTNRAGNTPSVQTRIYYAPTGVIYASHGSQDLIAQNLNGFATVTVVPDAFYVDLRGYAAVLPTFGGLPNSSGGFGITQGSGIGQSTSPFLTRNNATQTETFSVAPYVVHRFGSFGTFKAGYSYSYSAFSQLSGFTAFPLSTSDANGSLNTHNEVLQFTSGEDFGRFRELILATGTQFQGSGVTSGAYQYILTNQLGYAITPEVVIFGEVGVEDIHFSGTPTTNIQDFVWAVGAQWTPNPDSIITVGYGHKYGTESALLNASYALTARTRIYGQYQTGLGTDLTQLQSFASNTSVDPFGNSVDQTTGAPIGLTNGALRVSGNNNLYQTKTFTGGATVSLDRDQFTLQASWQDRKIMATTNRFGASSSSGYSALVGWTHQLNPDTVSNLYFSYGRQNGNQFFAGLGGEVEDTYAVQAAVRHNFTETLSGIAQYTYTDRVANIPGLSFTQNVFLLGLSKQF
jgi:uncharacterized protein (PEP-CTERM system associated)